MDKDIKQKVQQYPYVSVIIPMYNEENYIEYCLESLINQTYPSERMEIIVVDGMSSDRSREIVKKYQEDYDNIKLFDNPKCIVPVAMNIGIQNAVGEIIARIDAHSSQSHDFIKQSVHLLKTTGAVNVGGVLEAIGTNFVSKAIAIATSNPFGIGDSMFRFSRKERWVDTVFPGIWYKKTIDDIGGFNEEFVVNQDYELNYRLRKTGGKILLSPLLKSKYYVRKSIAALSRQYFRYGYWKVKTVLLHPLSMRWRHIISPLFVLLLLISIILIISGYSIGLLIPVMYGSISLIVSLLASIKNGISFIFILPIIFLTIHLSWGIGFLMGLLKFGISKIGIKFLKNAFGK